MRRSTISAKTQPPIHPNKRKRNRNFPRPLTGFGFTAKWFSNIAIEDNREDIKVSEEEFSILCKDIEIKKLRTKRKNLEKEVLLMTEGKKEMDIQKIKEYQELTKEIKGSGKK